MEDPPFVQYRYKAEGYSKCQYTNKKKCYEGLSIDIIEKLAEKFSFSYELVEEPNGKFGSPVSGYHKISTCRVFLNQHCLLIRSSP